MNHQLQLQVTKGPTGSPSTSIKLPGLQENKSVFGFLGKCQERLLFSGRKPAHLKLYFTQILFLYLPFKDHSILHPTR